MKNKAFYHKRINALLQYVELVGVSGRRKDAFRTVLILASVRLVKAKSEFEFLTDSMTELALEVEELAVAKGLNFWERNLGLSSEWQIAAHEALTAVFDIFNSEKVKNGEVTANGAPYRNYLQEARLV